MVAWWKLSWIIRFNANFAGQHSCKYQIPDFYQIYTFSRFPNLMKAILNMDNNVYMYFHVTLLL